MGNSDIRDLAHISKIDYQKLKGKTIAIDGHNWLYRYVKITTQYTDRKDYKKGKKEVPNLIGCIMGISKLTQKNVKPLIIFDGGYNELKKEELQRRQEKREAAKDEHKKQEEKGNKIEAAKYRSRSQSINDLMLKTTKELLDILDISHITAPKSAESQAAYICENNKQVNYAMSTDYDILLYGSPRTVRNFTSSSRDTELMNLEKTLEKHDITRKQLVEVSLLCGTDYFEGVKGIGPKTGLKIVKNNNIEEKVENIERFEKAKQIFLNPDVNKFEEEIKTPDPDINKARQYITEKWQIPEQKITKQLEKIKENTSKKTLEDF